MKNETEINLNKMATETISININVKGRTKLMIKVWLADILCRLIQKMFPQSTFEITTNEHTDKD